MDSEEGERDKRKSEGDRVHYYIVIIQYNNDVKRTALVWIEYAQSSGNNVEKRIEIKRKQVNSTNTRHKN